MNTLNRVLNQRRRSQTGILALGIMVLGLAAAEARSDEAIIVAYAPAVAATDQATAKAELKAGMDQLAARATRKLDLNLAAELERSVKPPRTSNVQRGQG